MKQVLSRPNLTIGGIGSLATLALLGKSNKTEAAATRCASRTIRCC